MFSLFMHLGITDVWLQAPAGAACIYLRFQEQEQIVRNSKLTTREFSR
jgi:hypothetical protein